MFNWFNGSSSQDEDAERNQLMELSEKELMVEIIIKLETSPGASGMQPRDLGRPWRGTLASGHKPR